MDAHILEYDVAGRIPANTHLILVLTKETPGSFMSTINAEMPLEPFCVRSVLANMMQ